MLKPRAEKKAINPLTGLEESYSLKISGTGYQAYAVVNLSLRHHLNAELGAGYYLSDYKITDQVEQIVVYQTNWKSEGG